MIVHDLNAIYPNLQIPVTGVVKIGLDFDVLILATLNWIGVGPEREIRKVAGTVTGIQTRRAISSNNSQMFACKFDSEWRRGMHIWPKGLVIIMHFPSNKP